MDFRSKSYFGSKASCGVALHCGALHYATAYRVLHCSIAYYKRSALSKGHCKIFSSFFCKCILQAAIDFAELRMRC